MATVAVGDPALERLWLDVELERLRLRARFCGVCLDPAAGAEVRERAVEWVRAGGPVPDEAAYLEWLERGARPEPGAAAA